MRSNCFKFTIYLFHSLSVIYYIEKQIINKSRIQYRAKILFGTKLLNLIKNVLPAQLLKSAINLPNTFQRSRLRSCIMSVSLGEI